MSIVKLIGAPYDVGCRSETATAIDQKNGPKALRSAISRMTRGLNVPLDFDDVGDIICDNTVLAVLKSVEETFLRVHLKKALPLIIGGAHTLTLGALRAAKKINPKFSLIYIDAHGDIMPHSEINYGSFLHYAIKEKTILPQQIGFVGTRLLEREELETIGRENIFNLTSLSVEEYGIVSTIEKIKASLPTPYYISIDLDSLDPSVAPGVSAPYPGGLSFRELLFLTRELTKCHVLGIDIVELSPINDINNQTANLAATLVLSLATTVCSISR
ncbi:MAG: arginase family protein [Deltaproteobacteria bacterium]|nr:arginase family protein [Deltaproteobacteria bacterium]